MQIRRMLVQCLVGEFDKLSCVGFIFFPQISFNLSAQTIQSLAGGWYHRVSSPSHFPVSPVTALVAML